MSDHPLSDFSPRETEAWEKEEKNIRPRAFEQDYSGV